MINRRNFLKKGSAAGAIIAVTGVASCNSPADKVKENDANAGQFIDAFELNEVTIDELQKKMQSSTLTSKMITEMYLKRIDAIDKNGPALNSVIEINPDALSIAENLDKERKDGKIRGSLHGIPVLIKDNINTGDKMMTTAGSLALVGHKAAKDAFVIQTIERGRSSIAGKDEFE